MAAERHSCSTSRRASLDIDIYPRSTAIMKDSMLFLAFGVALAASSQATADILQGDRFITVMKDNTVSGRTTASIAYNFYFLPGGAATYSDGAGRRITVTGSSIEWAMSVWSGRAIRPCGRGATASASMPAT